MKTLLSALLVFGALSISAIDVHADMFAPLGDGLRMNVHGGGSHVTPGAALFTNGVEDAGDDGMDDRVLFRFASADSVNAQFDAAMVLPSAMLSGDAQMDGALVVAAIGQTGEVRDLELVGLLATDPETTLSPNSPGPEPATLSFLGTGIVGAASVLRRRLGRA